MKSFRFGHAAVVAAAFGILVPATAARATLSSQEFKCSASLAKNFAKLQATILKITAKCHVDDISGTSDNPSACDSLPEASVAKVDKAKAKFIANVAKSCKSVCSISTDISCVSDLACPPKHVATPPNNSTAERCVGKNGSAPFRLSSLGWPGPYCESILGHPVTVPTDLGECVASLADSTTGAFDQAIFADLDETSVLTDGNLTCLAAIAKAVPRAATRAYVATASCRDARFSANLSVQPAWACAAEDTETVDAIQAELDKMSAAIDKACDDPDIAALDGLCADGGVAPGTVAQAQACLGDLVREVATEEHGGNRHVYSVLGMLNVSHPDSAAPYCGDGQVTTRREEHTGVGEECDGGADEACGAGSCLPPGDVFECTCDATARERFVVDGDAEHTDSDTGWLGASHDATHNDGFGYVTELSNCDCSEFSQATCTGTSTDPVCDVYGDMAPRCSDDRYGTQTCDARGNGNGIGENRDCFVCDENSINAGTWCANNGNANETLCQSQCFTNATGLAVDPQKACLAQTDCAEGETCKGRCDNSLTCDVMTEGSPLPLISASNPVCIMLEYKTDITGTKNIVTGETELHYTTRSLIQLGVFAQPCPLCGGVCVGGTNSGDSCFGRCNASNESCLLDSDCTGPGDTACIETADDCAGGLCSLDLRCSGGGSSLSPGKLCRPDSVTSLGVVSHDCLPLPNNAISGSGVLQNFGTVTTEQVEFPVGGACTDSTWKNYDCPCPADDGASIGVPTRPNSCAGACDGGVNEGKGCATGGGGSGGYTTCVGGTDAGLPCDSDTDCGGGTCSSNPKECTAGTASLIGLSCSTNANCGAGGVCSDACPGARCVPLCYEEGRCTGGARDGDPCSTLDHCKQCSAGNPLLIGTGCDINSRCNSTASSGDGLCEALGGVTCSLTDPEDGVCAAGPTKYRCTGAGFTSTPCVLDYGTCTSGTCSTGSPSRRGLPCTVGKDCLEFENVPVSAGCETGNDSTPGNDDDIVGAGECETRPEDCYVNNGFAEGGDTLNGDGSPSDVSLNATFCTPPSSNPAINSASGFGGPSRIRRSGAAFVNVPSIP